MIIYLIRIIIKKITMYYMKIIINYHLMSKNIEFLPGELDKRRIYFSGKKILYLNKNKVHYKTSNYKEILSKKYHITIFFSYYNDKKYID